MPLEVENEIVPSLQVAEKFAVRVPFAGEVPKAEAPARFAVPPWTSVPVEESAYGKPECVAETGNWQSARQTDQSQEYPVEQANVHCAGVAE